MKYILFSFMNIFVWSMPGYAFSNLQPCNSAEKVVIENFYKEYLNNLSNRYNNHLSLKFSKSLYAIMQENKKACSEKAGTDVCGWNADEDEYLDTQETDPNLTFSNAKFKFTCPQKGIVNVTFNVYPSMKDKEALLFYQKKIQFKLLQENQQWVVDDMVYIRKDANESIRQKMGNGLP